MDLFLRVFLRKYLDNMEKGKDPQRCLVMGMKKECVIQYKNRVGRRTSGEFERE